MEVIINDHKYVLIKNEKEGFELETVKEKMTEYFDEYDFVVGDWAYGKIRLKGFNKKNHKHYNKFNDSEKIENYIEEYCAYGCKYFVIERIKD